MDIFVRALGTNARLSLGGFDAPALVGAGGVSADKEGDKREGDKKTPRGRFALRRVWYRPDREAHPQSALPVRAITPDCGWCDDPAAPLYNRHVRLPYQFSHEKLWRRDHIYNLFIEIGFNDAPVQRGKGSAIFLHLAKANTPTAGCVALSRSAMGAVLARLTKESSIYIE